MPETFDFTIPETHSFEQIIARAGSTVSTTGRPRAAVVVPSDINTLKSFARAIKDGFVEPYLIGDERLARKNADENGIDLSTVRFISFNEPDMAVQTAIKMAVVGELDILINGRVPAVALLKQILNKQSLFVSKGNILSHVAVMKPALYRKLLLLSDAAVNMEPDLKAKLAIIDNAIRVAGNIGIGLPRVAVLAAVEAVYPHMPVTVDAAIIAKMADRNQIGGAIVDGPLPFDVAVDMAAARTKGIVGSPVAGQADILLAPDIATANGVYRAMTLFGRAAMGGVVVGGKVPVVLNSRSDSVDNRFNSIILATLMAGAR